MARNTIRVLNYVLTAEIKVFIPLFKTFYNARLLIKLYPRKTH